MTSSELPRMAPGRFGLVCHSQDTTPAATQLGRMQAPRWPPRLHAGGTEPAPTKRRNNNGPPVGNSHQLRVPSALSLDGASRSIVARPHVMMERGNQISRCGPHECVVA